MQPFPTAKFFTAAGIVVFLLYGVEMLAGSPVTPKKPPVEYSDEAKAHAQTITRFDPAQLDAALASGRPTMLYVFASWCPFCRQQTPAIEAFLAKSPKVSVIAISIDEDPVALASYLLTQPTLSFHPQLLDPEVVSLRDMLKERGLQYDGSIPYTAFFDTKGAPSGLMIGLSSADAIAEAYDKAR